MEITDIPGILWSGRLKISGEIDFSKKFVLSCVTRKDWASRTGWGWQFAATPEVSEAHVRRKPVGLAHILG